MDNINIKKRHIIQWCLLPIVLITIGLGWKYPLLGFSVPIVMLTGLAGGLINGRYVCGNLCPRGSFLDRVIPHISPNKHIPSFLRNMLFRWIVFAALMGFLVFRISRNPSDIYHWGKVFWVMCVITTGIGVVLGVLIRPRAWCSFCPIGTMQNALGGHKNQLRIDTDLCVGCKKCQKVCPLDLDVASHKEGGVVRERDCLKCSECIVTCPKDALTWPQK